MHETALMQQLLSVVDRAARESGEGPVRVVHLRIGEMSGVSVEALRFAFEVLSRGGVAEGAALECERVPLAVRCAACGATSHPDDYVFRCARCGSPEIEIIAGREMEVDYIAVGDESVPETDTDVPSSERPR